MSKEIYEKRYREANIEECPFCHTPGDDLYAGATSSLSSGVRCKCGAGMSIDYPDDMPESDRNEIDLVMQFLDLDPFTACTAYYTLKAVSKWNRRDPSFI